MRFTLILLCILMPVAQAAAYTSASKHLEETDDWYRGEEAKTITANVLSWQAPDGGWPKNIDTATRARDRDPARVHSTFDNGATTFELRFLARMIKATSDPRCRDAFNKGLKHILQAQYTNGGWPQQSPPDDDYSRYITFNDGAMGRVMFFCRDVAKDELYSFVDAEQRGACAQAWDKAIDCILKCQVKVDGRLTAWCAQHDEKTLEPRPARAFELVSLSGCESIGLIHALMEVENPSPEVIAAVDAAVAWLDSVKITGIRVEDRPQKDLPKGFERVVVEDPDAPPMWARFYEIGTNRPIFVDRDGVAKYKLSEIGHERRNGYRWLSYWPDDLLAKEYPKWKAKLAKSAATRQTAKP